MGGFGSTRWGWVSTKDTVESSRSLDINRLNRAGCLHPGYRGGWEWTRDAERVASIWFRRDGDRLILSLPGSAERRRMAGSSSRRRLYGCRAGSVALGRI
jgi:hypothetical protein